MRTLKRKDYKVQGSDLPPGKRHTSTWREANAQFQDGKSLRQRAKPYELATARMPFSALATVWKQGMSRPIRRQHVSRLLGLFLHGGDGKPPGVVREAPENYLLVQCTKEAVRRMKDHLASGHGHGHGHGGENDNGCGMDNVLSFLDWAQVNGVIEVEVMNGLHRMATLIKYVEVTNSDAAQQLWWTCIIYDQGEYKGYMSTNKHTQGKMPGL